MPWTDTTECCTDYCWSTKYEETGSLCRVGQEINDDAERKPDIGQCKPAEDEVEQVVKCLNVEEEHAASRQQNR